MIRRIEIHESICRQIVQDLFVILIANFYVGLVQIFADGSDDRFVYDVGIFIFSEWRIELSLTIHPIQPIVTCFIQINNPRSPFDVRKRSENRFPVERAEGIKIFRRIFMSLQVCDQLFRIVSYDLIYIDQFPVIVIYNSTLRLQFKKQGSAAYERFVIYRPDQIIRQQPFYFGNKLSFPSDPFQERCYKFILSHRLVQFIAEVSPAGCSPRRNRRGRKAGPGYRARSTRRRRPANGPRA